jgi:NADH dehydrogenase
LQSFAPEPPAALRPTSLFTDDLIRAALPEGRFGLHDLRLAR